MSLRRLSPREYVVDFLGTLACWPVYSHREWLARESLDAFAIRRARAMAVHAAEHVPTYRDLYRDHGVDPRAIRTWDDFARLPRLAKAELAADQAEHAPFGSNLTYPLARYVRVFQTSGRSFMLKPLNIQLPCGSF